MQYVRDSVHQLLDGQIQRLGLQEYYEVQKAEAIGKRTQTSFTFHGLRDRACITSSHSKAWHGDPDHP